MPFISYLYRILVIILLCALLLFFALEDKLHSDGNIILRSPTLEDGMAVFHLIERCPPLDANSNYCNMLQCDHFAKTSVAASAGAEIVGFISGYLVPNRPKTLFIWQVAVDEKGRGQGLASRMLLHLLKQSACEAIQFLETSITADNQASWALFEALAKKLDTNISSFDWLDELQHFKGRHASERLVRIGPFNESL